MHFYRSNCYFGLFRFLCWKVRVRLFYTPRTRSLYAFLSFKVLFRPFQGLLRQSAGTAILHASDAQFVCIFIVQTAILTFSKPAAKICGYGLFTPPPTRSLYAFLSSKLRVQGVSAGGVQKCGYGHFITPRRAVCMHFYDMICVFRGVWRRGWDLRVRSFYNPILVMKSQFL